MDIEGICSDLQSLRKLYGLLKNDGQGLPNESSDGFCVPTDKLDQQARLLLRDLLDTAAERIFKAQTEILAVRHSVDTLCSSQQGESKDMLKLQPPLFLKYASSNSGSVLQSTSKKINTQKDVSERDKWVPIEPKSQVDPSEQSRLNIFGSEPQVRKKRCRVCLRSTVKQPKVLDWQIQNPNKRIDVQSQLHNPSFEFHAGDLLVEGKMSSNKAMHSAIGIETQRQKGSFEHQSSPVGVGSESACSSDKPAADIVESGDLHNFAADPVKKSEEADQISKEASIKIQLIELRMLALQVAAKPAHTLQIQTGAPYGWNELTSISDIGSESVSSMLQRKKRLVTRNELSEAGDFVVGRSDPKSRLLGRRVWEPTQWHQVPKQVRKTELSNQANSRILKPLPPSGAAIRQTMTQTVEKNKQIAFEYDRLSEVWNPIEGCKVPDQDESQVPEKNVKAIIDRIESPSQVTSRNDHTPMQTNKFIQCLRLPANRNRIVSTDLHLRAKLQSQLANENLDRNRTRLKKTIPIVETALSSNWNKMVNTDILLPAKLQNQLEKEKLDQNRTTLKKKIPIVETSKSSTPSVGSKFIMRHNSKLQASNVGSELNRTRTKAATLMPPHRMTRRTLPDHKSTQFRVSPTSHEDRPDKGQGSFQKRKNHVGTQRFISPSQEVSESTCSRSHYSSSWESQQVSTSFSDDEGYSVSGQTGTRELSDPSTSSESVVYLHHNRTGARKVIYSSSDSEMYSVSSRSRGHQLDSDTSSESQEYLSSNRSPVHGHIGSLHQSVGSTSRRMYLAKSRRLEKKPQVGRLKKLKDKLAIIFHHHHHHHHHHDYGDDDNQHVEVRGGKSLWKHAGKIFDRRSEEAYGEQTVKKIRKSAAGSAQDKNQRGHFHTLVEGLLQHVRLSKKSKVAKGGIARPGNGQHGAKKKKVKKLHWWQMLQHQRGLKMPKKPRGTLRVGRKNPKLKALPKPR